jgi:hypothetical protein
MFDNQKVNAVGMVLMVALSALAGIAVMGASTAHDTAGNDTVIVDKDGNNGNYTSIQNAVDNSSKGDYVHIYPATYNTSVNLTTGNLTFENANVSEGNVTIDATNTSSGIAFRNPSDYNYTVGENVTVKEASVSGGSGLSGDYSWTDEYAGIPLWAIVIGTLLIVGYGYMKMEE